MDIGIYGGLVRSVLMSIRASYTRVIYPKSGLGAKGQQSSYRSDGMYIKDVENPVEAQLPGSDRFLIVLCVIKSRDRIPFTPLYDVPLDLVHSPDREP